MNLWNFLRGTTSNTLGIGDGVNSTKAIEANIPGANKPVIRFNHTTDQWEFSHDGSNFFVFSPLITAAVLGNLLYPIGCIYESVVSTSPATLFGFGTWSAFGTGQVLVGIDATQTEFDTIEETGGEKTHALSSTENGAHAHTVDPPSTASGNASATHTHTGTSGTESADHTHTGSGTSAGQSSDHNHSGTGTTGGQSADHVHSTQYWSGAGGGSYGYQIGSWDSAPANQISTGVASAGHTHNISFVTGVASIGHTHTFSFTTAGKSATHTHSITTGTESATHTHTTDIAQFDSGTSGTGTAHNNLQPYIVVYRWKRTA